MHRRTPLRGACPFLVIVPLVTSGCVFDDIRDELVTVNENMAVTQQILRDAGTTLDEVHEQLDEVQKTNELLVELQAGLGTEGMAEAQSKNRASIIGTMESIDRSLAKMDEHLTVLRKTISNIDSTIPFLKFSAESDEPEDDAVPEPGAAPSPASVPTAEAEDHATVTGPSAEPGSNPESD